MCSTPLDTAEHKFMRAVVRQKSYSAISAIEQLNSFHATRNREISLFFSHSLFYHLYALFKSILFAFCEHVRSHTIRLWLSWPDGTSVRNKNPFQCVPCVSSRRMLNTNLWLFDCVAMRNIPFSATCPQHQSTVTPNTFHLLHSRTHKFRSKHS